MRNALTRAWDVVDAVMVRVLLYPPLLVYGAWFELGEWLRGRQGGPKGLTNAKRETNAEA